MASFTSVPAELGILGTPKFLAKLASKDRYWKKRKFKAPEERGVANPDVLEGIQSNVLAFYTALIATCGEEEALEIYARGSEKMGLMMYEEFFPSAKDFSGCEDTWGAFARYLLEFLRTWEREGVAQRFGVRRIRLQRVHHQPQRSAAGDHQFPCSHGRFWGGRRKNPHPARPGRNALAQVRSGPDFRDGPLHPLAQDEGMRALLTRTSHKVSAAATKPCEKSGLVGGSQKRAVDFLTF